MEEMENQIYSILKSNVDKSLEKSCALAYSGGLDSSLLLALSNYRYIPYTLGFSNSRDIEHVEDSSLILNLNVKKIILDDIDIENYIKELKNMDPKISKMELGYELVLFILMDYIPEKYVVTGQGADEIFYGYRRFVDNPHLRNDTYMNRLFNVTLPRETKMAEYYDKELITPFLDPEILKLRKKITREMNIAGDKNKVMLRHIAEAISVPKEIYSRNKTAAQYGSGITKYLMKSV
ncbi:MAG: asparagine synthase-related protein [Ferroplasma sp.]